MSKTADVSFRAGYDTARKELRVLLAKVDEKHKMGVVRAWLLESLKDDKGS